MSRCRAPHPDGAGSAPFHSPQCAVGHGTHTSQPGAMTGASPWLGCAPHGIWDLGEGRDRLHRAAFPRDPRVPRHVTPSSPSQGSSPPHGSMGRSQEELPRYISRNLPSDNSPVSGSPNPNPHPDFPPNKPKPAALQTERDSSSRIWLPGSLLAAQSGFH